VLPAQPAPAGVAAGVSCVASPWQSASSTIDSCPSSAQLTPRASGVRKPNAPGSVAWQTGGQKVSPVVLPTPSAGALKVSFVTVAPGAANCRQPAGSDGETTCSNAAGA